MCNRETFQISASAQVTRPSSSNKTKTKQNKTSKQTNNKQTIVATRISKVISGTTRLSVNFYVGEIVGAILVTEYNVMEVAGAAFLYSKLFEEEAMLVFFKCARCMSGWGVVSDGRALGES